jgi:hypothetical protein
MKVYKSSNRVKPLLPSKDKLPSSISSNVSSSSPSAVTQTQISPSQYFKNILESRGYEFVAINGLDSPYLTTPTPNQILSYDNVLLQAVRDNDISKLTSLYQQGHTMTACNSYCESILHYAARRGSKDIVKFLLLHGAICFVDDCGRLPMHDVCWRHFQKYEIANMLLEYDVNMLYVKDRHGACPLDYVNPRHWAQWCAYLDTVKDKYWPIKEISKSDVNPIQELQHLISLDPFSFVPQDGETSPTESDQRELRGATAILL